MARQDNKVNGSKGNDALKLLLFIKFGMVYYEAYRKYVLSVGMVDPFEIRECIIHNEKLRSCRRIANVDLVVFYYSATDTQTTFSSWVKQSKVARKNAFPCNFCVLQY
ncbi:hypothetical protein HMPREF9372_2032 [Sporosarcina newyorkensis 2681]|uniref:Uncharacterized protein n=1 Tax=Sporosarcina newyorkensis 2681 TaxID=1027292 RepID=F9DTA1_9BACL|nr:hypothetical protein HMPREF9372_2032 [Sporosarcina newyorkensis 2681]